jgi:hypothetical protein
MIIAYSPRPWIVNVLSCRFARRVPEQTLLPGFEEFLAPAVVLAPYNGVRPSQAIHPIPAPHPELRASPPAEGTLIALPVLGGLHHDYRLAA